MIPLRIYPGTGTFKCECGIVSILPGSSVLAGGRSGQEGSWQEGRKLAGRKLAGKGSWQLKEAGRQRKWAGKESWQAKEVAASAGHGNRAARTADEIWL